MPSKSVSQQKLMGMAYSCKVGQSNYCPPKIQKIADSMSKDDLEDFARTKHTGLPKRVKESITYKTDNANRTLLFMLKEWLTNKGVEFTHDDNELKIMNNYNLNEEDKSQLSMYIDKIGLERFWENVGTPAAGMGSGMSTLSNTIGVKFVDPPAPNKIGSGDKFDTIQGGNTSDLQKKKKKLLK